MFGHTPRSRVRQRRFSSIFSRCSAQTLYDKIAPKGPRSRLRRGLATLHTAAAALALGAGWAAPQAQAAGANDYPSRAITMVVPFSPGGGTDVMARVVAQELATRLGVSVVVENKPGAAGAIGAASVSKAAPDGYTLLAYHIAMVTVQHQQKIPYDPLKDFTPITLLCTATNVVAVNAGLPAKDFKEFVALAKSKPGVINFGSSGTGGSDHLGGLLLQKITGTQLTHIPYKGGGPANMAAAANEVQLTAGTVAQSSPLIKAGKLRGLVVMQKERSPSLPDVPSTAEMGYPDLDHKTWFGLWGPANMPPEVVAKLSAALKQVLASPKVSESFTTLGAEPKWTTPEDFAAMNRDEYDKWNRILGDKPAQ